MVYRGQGEAKEPQRGGLTGPCLRNDGRYEARATLNTTTGRRRVSFYGTTAKEAEDERLKALAEQAKGIIFSDPGQLLRYLRHRRHKFIAARVAL